MKRGCGALALWLVIAPAFVAGRDAGDLPEAPAHVETLDRQALLNYARAVLLYYLGLEQEIAPPPEALNSQGACFITFFHRGRVLACLGSFQPRTGNLAREIEANIRQALSFDPRAKTIDPEKALSADVQITFPGEPQPIASIYQLDPAREGLLVENDRAGVAIVPGEAKTASWALRRAMKRLGERDPRRLRLFKFKASVISTRQKAD